MGLVLSLVGGLAGRVYLIGVVVNGHDEPFDLQGYLDAQANH